MLSFQMSVDVALEFWQRVKDRNANTEEERVAILVELADEGKLDNIVHTNRTKEQYKNDLKKEFNVLDVTENDGEDR